MAAQAEDVPPQPKAVLRGHKSPVHAAVFYRANERLLTGDADGYVVSWDLTIMRPRAVWQAHENAILGLCGWGPDKVITHGRDNKLIVWKMSADDESFMSTTLPLDPVVEPRTKPWMLHLLEVNTMNFCSFAVTSSSTHLSVSGYPSPADAELFVAVPNTLASEAVDIYQLPSQTRRHTVRMGDQNGMAMALALLWLEGVLTLIMGYENGMAIVAQLEQDGSWRQIYRNQSHTQTILSLDVAPDLQYFLTSSADAAVSKHPLLSLQAPVTDLSGENTEITDPEVEVESPTIVEEARPKQGPKQERTVSLLSAALASEPQAESSNSPQKRQIPIQTLPLKVVNTKHSGQQSLRVRSDSRVFATAGWDSKVRVYSAKTMREVAVLKWHSVGCFAVAFADLNVPSTDAPETQQTRTQRSEDSSHEAGSLDRTLTPKQMRITVKERRLNQAKAAHWLAAGSKDGKVSLWDIF